jgi:hypothetical protein
MNGNGTSKSSQERGFVQNSSSSLSGGCQFLLDRKAVRWSREDGKNPKASFESDISIEPLMVEHSESAISICNLCNHEQLVALTHDAVSS